MFNVLIADDERTVRESIVKNVNWASLDMKVVAEAADGLEALRLLDGCDALHVALVDIYMPNMNGLQLAETIKKWYPQCKIVIITGYDDFEYVRSALRMGVFDYVLKPITKSELNTLLQEIRYKLEEDALDAQSESHLRGFIGKAEDLIWQEAVNALLRGEKHDVPFTIPKNTRFMACALLDPDETGKETCLIEAKDDLISFVLCNIANEQLGAGGFALRTWQYQCAVVFFSPQKEKMAALEKAAAIMSEIRAAMWDAMKMRVSVGIGALVASGQELAASYAQAQSALERRFVKGSGVTCYEDFAELNAQPLPPLDELLKALSRDNEEVLLNHLHGVIAAIAAQPDVNDCRSQMITLIVLLCKAMQEHSSVPIMAEPVNIYALVQNAKTLDELENWCVELIKRFRTDLRENAGSLRHISQQIKAFVNESYANNSLSFQSLCEALHFSPSYVAMVFRKEMQCTFVEYLTRYRMERACELLKNPEFCSYEVAERVGFSNPHYFSLVFKKIMGLTPTKYREQAKEALLL